MNYSYRREMNLFIICFLCFLLQMSNAVLTVSIKTDNHRFMIVFSVWEINPY